MPPLLRLVILAQIGWTLPCLSGCQPASPAAAGGRGAVAARAESIVAGEAITIQPEPWAELVRVQGSLDADEVAAIGAKVAGRVVRVAVDLGDEVAAGAELVVVDNHEYQLLVEQADAELRQARSVVGLRDGDPLDKLNPDNAATVREATAIHQESLKAVQRIRQLAEENAVSESDVELAESAESVAAARLTSAYNGVREKIAMIAAQTAQWELAKQNLVDTVIRAPFAGMIQRREIAVGSYVQPGQPLFTLVRVDPVRFRSAVPERHAHRLQLGQEVRISLALSRQQRSAKITRISPTLDPLNRCLTFEATIENADHSLRAGLFAEADVVLDSHASAIVIPQASLLRFAGVDKVWKIEGEEVREQIVRLGRQEAGRCEILDGLQAGDRILRDATAGRTGRYRPADSPPADDQET
jgi:RND family efflux transporter MFP subunit